MFPCLVYFVYHEHVFNWEEFYLRDFWGLDWIFTIAHLSSESLLGNTPVTIANLQKWLGTFSSLNRTISLTLFFWEFIFTFDVRCVSHKFTTYSCLKKKKKWLLVRFILSVVLHRKFRFLTTVDVVLKEYNNCLPNNKWLGVKHVLIVFG